VGNELRFIDRDAHFFNAAQQGRKQLARAV
jgi:hypothetical protein